MKLDLRDRCQRCHKLIRGKLAEANYQRYKPYCSFHCESWASLESSYKRVVQLRNEDAESS